ncbi:hypothetical protein K491DRAFT_702974 [Lophiostoma macrostomum CBS 122681]|uniref:Uncharacterized protein n=1 Tax=Lophiostoma macrostomum CBS 122681 TaxID=1314788 RepID=A0A6A6TDX5_9PLEO|nr:hypothetical protein K491DRAFT_702974 [Lophiostoma macrostomum CBS 122681]
MFLFSRWTRKRREERRRIKETKKRDDEKAQALLLTLHELQRTMDPLLAVQVYNNRFCPLISRLPEEILLCILDFLCEEVVTLQSIICKDAWYRGASMYTRGNARYLDPSPRLQFRQLLQRDGRCDNCRHWNKTHAPKLFDDCKFQEGCRRLYDDTQVSSLHCRLHCHACDSLHDISRFFSNYQKSWEHHRDRRCIGQEGSVQLCEHIQITWASIKAHIDNWRQQQHGERGDWQVCLDSFLIECHNTNHDMRCTPSEAPTWPRARLGTSRGSAPFESSVVVLILEWTPHSRIDALRLTTDGRIPAPELRALFQRLRRLGPANILWPPCRPGALPEMAFFSLSSDIERLVYYKTGEADEIGPLSASFSPLPTDKGLSWRAGLKGLAASGTGISSQCLVVSYKKDIMICKQTDIRDPAVKIMPTCHWLHAMDTKTYPHPRASHINPHIRPQCRNVACNNYYQRRKDYYACYPFRGV